MGRAKIARTEPGQVFTEKLGFCYKSACVVNADSWPVCVRLYMRASSNPTKSSIRQCSKLLSRLSVRLCAVLGPLRSIRLQNHRADSARAR